VKPGRLGEQRSPQSSTLEEREFGTVEDIDRTEGGSAMAKERTAKKAGRW
jgi:hypothetical protein